MPAYDIHFQPVSSDRVQGFKCFEFGYKSALKVTGFQYLINRWIKVFMTPIGSDPLDREYGTAAAGLIGANVTRLSTEVQDVVALSVVQTNEQIKVQDVEGLFPDNERLQNATIEQYVETESGFDVWIAIENMAGQRLSVPVLPLGDVRY